MANVLIEVIDAKKHFPRRKGIFSSKATGYVKAVDGVTFSIDKGEIFGLVGESGCGKTTVGKLILLLEYLTSGSILFQGKPINDLSKEQLSNYRASVQAMFQDPYGSLNPRMRAGQSIAEPLIESGSLSKKTIGERVEEVINEVGLSSNSSALYPHQFSGGQRQRIALARALILRPSFIVLDEPVSALDVSVRAQIMNLLMDIHKVHGVSYLLIAHDLSVVKHMCNRVGVMYVGRIIEYAQSHELYRNPYHPYTRALFSAVLAPNPNIRRKVIVLPGEVPSPVNPPPGCHFHPRCGKRLPYCSEVEPAMKEINPGHLVSCHLYDE